MKGIRKIVTNNVEIQMAQQYNVHVKADYVNSPFPAPLSPVPNPIYDTQVFNFRLDLVTNFYIEKDTLNNKYEGDIILNIMYEGLVRLQYDPLVEQTLEIALNNK